MPSTNLKHLEVFDAAFDHRPAVGMVVDGALRMRRQQDRQQRVLAGLGELQEGFGFKPELFLAADIGHLEQDLLFAAPRLVDDGGACDDNGLDDFDRAEPLAVVEDFGGIFGRAVLFLTPQVEVL